MAFSYAITCKFAYFLRYLIHLKPLFKAKSVIRGLLILSSPSIYLFCIGEGRGEVGGAGGVGWVCGGMGVGSDPGFF